MTNNEDEGQSASDMAKHFGEATPVEKEPEENSIYNINARVKNLARNISGGHLTPVGDILCNSMSHVLKKLYAFAETLPEADRERLKLILAKTEEMPGDVIYASRTGIVPPRIK